jgi:hypothetical protein
MAKVAGDRPHQGGRCRGRHSAPIVQHYRALLLHFRLVHEIEIMFGEAGRQLVADRSGLPARPACRGISQDLKLFGWQMNMPNASP